MSQEELNVTCEDMFNSGIVMNHEECSYLEESTCLQSQSLLWFQHRIDCVTASKFYAVKHASLDPTPGSVINNSMERNLLSNYELAIQWGITHEDVAREAYLELASEKHTNLQCSAAGLHVNPNFPHFDASPDGLIICDCCGEGLIEIKCP